MALVFSVVDMKVTLASSAKINSIAHRECPPSFRTRLNSEATEITVSMIAAADLSPRYSTVYIWSEQVEFATW